MPAQEVLAYDKVNHTLAGRYANGYVLFDPNFHIDIVRRCGYSLTAEPSAEFRGAPHA